MRVARGGSAGGDGEDALPADADGVVGELDLLGDAVDDLADLPGEAVGLGDARDAGVAEPGAQQGGELAEAVEALVVDLDDEDVLVLVERRLEARGERVEVAHLHVAGLDAGGAQAAHGFTDRAVGAAPADEEYVARGIAGQLGSGHAVGDRLDFLAAL